MILKLISEIAATLIRTIEQTAVVSVRSLKQSTFKTQVSNFPKIQKVSGEVTVDQSSTQKELKKVVEHESQIISILKKLRFPTQIEVSNLPKSVEVSNIPKVDFPKSFEVSNLSSIDTNKAIREVVKAIREQKLDPKISVQVPKLDQVVVPPANVTVKQQEIDYKKLSKEIAKIVPNFDYDKFKELLESSIGGITISAAGGGKYAYKNEEGRGTTALVDGQGHVQVDVKTMPAVSVDTSGMTEEIKILNGAYAMRVDDVGGGVIYQGWAEPGSATSAAAWRIRRITSSGTPEDTTIVFADGDSAFNNIWDNRTSLDYS